MTALRYLSVCSGIEAATQAWHPLGWQPAAFSEIEPFPCAVLAHHYPHVPNFGDMTKFEDWPDDAIDLLCGGTPCQSFSVAGLRKGLADPRGNLMLTFGSIAGRYRPRWLVWENVPGVLSSNGGLDFGAFLGMLGELGYGFAYRVLDAQHVRTRRFPFAVPQRRRRVFVVGYLGDWRRAAAVLFDRESLSGHPAPRREAGQIAPTIPARSLGGGGLGTDFDCDGWLICANSGDVGYCLTASAQNSLDAETETLLAVDNTLRAEGFDASEDGTGRGTPLVPVAIQERAVCENQNAGPGGAGIRQDGASYMLEARTVPQAVAFGWQNSASQGDSVSEHVAPTLDKSKTPAVATHHCGVNQGYEHASTSETNPGEILSGVRKALGEEAFAEWGLGILWTLQSAEVLRSALHGRELRPAAFSRSWVVNCALSRPQDRGTGAVQSLREAGGAGCSPHGWEPYEQRAIELGAYLSGLSQPGPQAERFMLDLWQASEGLGLLREALSAVQAARRSAGGEDQSAHGSWAVRRLTPEECEFLQAMPRGYTHIPYRGKPADNCPDGPRYKALGNSWAVNCAEWIGERIAEVDTWQ